MTVAVHVRRALQETAKPLGEGALVRPLPFTLGPVRADLQVVPVEDEMSRRAGVGLGALTDRRKLALLADLPADLPVPAEHLSRAALRDLRRLPAGCAEVSAVEVTRELVPAVRVSAAVVSARTWDAGLRRVSRFSPFCARSVVLPRTPTGPALDMMLLQAVEYGVGVAVPAAGGLSWLVSAKAFVPHRRSVASWLFEEQVFAKLLQAQG